MEVVGPIHSLSNGFFDGAVGIGTTTPSYKLQVNNGSISLYNSTDNKFWNLNYSSASNYFSIQESGSSRLVILNGGNVGIGTVSPSVKLDVAGSGNFDGPLYVNGNKGVVHNASSTTNLKVHLFTTLKFTAILGGH